MSFDASIFVPLLQEKKRNYASAMGAVRQAMCLSTRSLHLPLQEKKEITKLADVGAVRQAM